ncbi:MAG: T9SS type A sorting domain-containing protein [Ginsengibacter sp.]
MKISALVTAAMLLALLSAGAAVTLTAIPDARGAFVSLRWNMINHKSQTAYLLLRSVDGVIWEVAAANPVFRSYTSSTILAFIDRVNYQSAIMYKVRVYDGSDKTIALSNIATVHIPRPIYQSRDNGPFGLRAEPPQHTGNKSWKIFPNPVGAMLNLTYVGRERLKGIINVSISDASGKLRIRFRQASNNPQLRILVSNLSRGIYFMKIIVENETQLAEKFVKQ